jgi:general transcription factor IIIA
VHSWKCAKPGCAKSYSAEKILKEHISEKHPDGESEISKTTKAESTQGLRCNYEGCDKAYSTKKALNRHVKEKHSVVKK